MRARPVYYRGKRLGVAANYIAAARIATDKLGGQWTATFQWHLRGRKRVPVYVIRQHK